MSKGNNIKIMVSESDLQMIYKALKCKYQESKCFDYVALKNMIEYQTKKEEKS